MIKNVIILFLFFISLKLCCHELTTPVEVHLPIFLKSLTFDKNFNSGNSDTIFIHFIYQINDRNSVNFKNILYYYLNDKKIKSLNNKTLVFIEIPIKTEEDFRAYLNKNNVKYLYIAPFMSADINAIAAICCSKKILTMTGVTEYIESGIAVSLDIKGNKPQILLNLENSRKQGANFNSRLLNLVKIVD